MSRYLLLSLTGVCLFALLVGCSTIDEIEVDGTDDLTRFDAVDGFSLDVWDDALIQRGASQFQLDVTAEGQDRIASIRAIDASGLTGLFATIGYDNSRYYPAEVSFGSALGEQDQRLELHGEAVPGELQVGQVLVNPERQPGLSGDGELVWIRFAPGQSEINRNASGPPTGEQPLLVWNRSIEHTPSWTFGGPGDYDQNGEVNVSDLTPIAINFAKSGAFNPLSLDYIVDGDHNGEINAADITPIAIHFGETVDGYNVYISGPPVGTSGIRGVSVDGMVPYDKVAGSEFEELDGVKQVMLDVLIAETSIHDAAVVGVHFDSGAFSVLHDGEHAFVAVAPFAGEAEGPVSHWIGGDPELIPTAVWDPPVAGSGTPGHPFQLEPDSEYSLELHDTGDLNITPDYRLRIWDVEEPLRFASSSMQASGLRQASDSVLFSTTGGIDPPSFSIISQSFTDLSLARFDTFGADDFTVPDAGWDVQLVEPGTELPDFEFFATPQPVVTHFPVVFDASKVFLNPDPPIGDITIGWDFDDDGLMDIMTPEPKVVHPFEFPGLQKVTMTVFESDGVTVIGGMHRNIPVFLPFDGNAAPVVDAQADDTVPPPGGFITIHEGGSSDPDDGIGDRVVAGFWELVSGDPDDVDIADPVSLQTGVQFSETAIGDYLFKLLLMDLRGGVSSDTVNITVTDPSAPLIEISHEPLIVYEGAEVEVTVTVTDDNGVGQVELDFDGDGTPEPPILDGGGLQEAVFMREFVWPVRGDVEIVVDALNLFGIAGHDTLNVEVREDNVPPTIEFITPADGAVVHVGEDTTFEVHAEDNAGIDTITIDIDNDGSFETEDEGLGSIALNSSRIQPITETRPWEVKAEVTDVNGVKGSAIITVNATEQPVADLVITPPLTRIDRQVIFDASGSSDNDGTIINYEYDFDGDGTYDLNTNQAVVSHSFTSTMDLWSTVRVTDNIGAKHTATSIMTVKNAAVWNQVVADDGGPASKEVGCYADLAIIDGRPAIAYYNVTDQDLMYVRAENVRGLDWGTPIVVSETAGVDDGYYPELLETAGNPIIIHHNSTDGDVEIIYADDAVGTTWSGAAMLDGTFYNAGQGLSAEFVNGVPAISYYDTTSDNVIYLSSTAANGTTWSTPKIVTSAGSSIHWQSATHLSVNSSGFPVVTSRLGDKAIYNFATDIDGTAWSTVAEVSEAAGPHMITRLVAGQPTAFYPYLTDNTLLFETASSPTGANWANVPVEVGSIAGIGELAALWPDQTPSLYIDSINKFFIAAGSSSSGLTIYTSEAADGATWNAGVNVDSSAGAGEFGVSMAITPDGRAAVAWWDSVRRFLMYAYYDDAP